jgi:hypothetical protein
VHLGDSGIVLSGPADPFGVKWSWTGDHPWTPGVSPRSVTGDRATGHGSWDATEFYGSRSYALEGYAQGSSHEALHAAYSRFSAVVGIRPFLFRVVEPGFDRQAWFRRDSQPSWREVNQTTAIFSVPIIAKDPLIYSTELHSATAGFPSSTGGATWPATWPLTWDTDVVDGTLSLSNAGTETAWPIFRIDGPVVDPRLVNTTTGEQMVLSLTLLSGEFVTVDTGTHQVLGNGDTGAPRRDRFSGQWFGLEPGPNSINFQGLSGGAGAQVTATFRDTWV